MGRSTTRILGRRDFLRWAGAAGAVAGASLGGRGLLAPLPPVAAQSPGADDGGVLRLNANENPLGPSPAARRAIEAAIQDGNRYPIAEREELIDSLARVHGMQREQVLPGCGSTELLRACVSALAAGGRLVMAEPTYEDPHDYSRPFGVKAVRVPLNADGAHDLPAMERAVREGTRLVYVCNPNNPTGTVVGGEALAGFVRRVAKRATLLVDEAYHDYVADPGYASMVPLIQEGLPVVVTRTFSKIHGLAGLRLGYALGDAWLLERAAAHLTFAGTSVLAVRAALASLDDKPFLEQCRRENAAARERLSAALVARGFPVFTSQTNFVMFRLGSDVRSFIADMESRRIRVGRPFPPLIEHCRVSLGTVAQIDRFVAEIDAWRQAAAA